MSSLKINSFKKSISVILLLCLVICQGAWASVQAGTQSKADKAKPASEGWKTVESMKFDPIKFQVPRVGREIERVVLDNGMILYLREDHSLPLIKIEGVIRTGLAYEKKDKAGVANLTGIVLRTGGTKKLSPTKLNEELDFMATDINSYITREQGAVTLDVTTSQLDKALNIYAQILRTPAFDIKEVELAKSQIKEEIRRQNDEITALGLREFYALIYPDYCDGWKPNWQIIKKIKREDLIAWYKRFYHPNNMMFTIVGDFDKGEMVKKFNKLFGDWPAAKVNLSGLQDFEKELAPGVYYVQKETAQPYILMGQQGVKRNNPDRYALEMMDFIMGSGGFNSLITEKVRSDEGLAYMVGSYLSLNRRVFGAIVFYCKTKSASTVKAIELIIAQAKKMQTDLVTEKQMEWARSSIINSFIFEFNTPFKQTFKLMMLEYDHMPADFYEKYCENIRSVTRDQIREAARKYLATDKLKILVVGDIPKLDKPLSTLGKPEEIKLKDFKD